MTTPIANIDNTTLLNLTPNLDIGDIADPALRLLYFQYLNVYIQTITSAFNAFVANGAIATGNLADLSITSAKLADLAVQTGKIADFAVVTSKINDLAVSAAKIAVGTITSAQIADQGIATGDLADALITTIKIADANVTTAKLIDACVTLAKMAANSVGTTQLVDLSVTRPKIAVGAVGASQLDSALLDTVTLNSHRLQSVIDHPDGSVPDVKLGNNPSDIKARVTAHLAETVTAIENAKTGHGAVGNGSTDDTTAIQTSVTAGLTSSVYVPKGNYPVTALDNKNGVQFNGIGKIIKNGVLYNAKGYEGNIFGINYLSSFHKKIIAGTAAKVVFSGDSTTQGFGVVSPTNYVDQLFLSAAQFDGFANLTVLNRGQGGKDTNDWVTTYLAGDLAANPDLLVLRWGINDPFNGRTLAQFITSLRSGLTTIRTSRNLASLSIILMTPNSTSDTPNGRNELWYESMTPAIREAARDFNCCFIDTYSLFQDSRNASDWMDDPFGDGRHIHPIDVGNYFITSAIYDVAIPTMLKVRYGFKQQRTLAAINYYVDPVGGNDSNSGAIGSKFKTIQHAIDILPYAIDHTATITVSAGTSTEQILIAGFTGKANIVVTGAALGDLAGAANYKFRNVTIKNCKCAISIIGFEATEAVTDAFFAENTQWCAFDTCRTTGAGTNGFVSHASSVAYIVRCLTSNKTGSGIIAQYLSRVFSQENTGTGNSIGLSSSQASTLGKQGTQPGGTTAESATNGGVIR